MKTYPVFNAIAAINELLDASPFLGLAGKNIALSVVFDEFNLDVRAVYEGMPFEIPVALPCIESMQDAEATSLALVAFTMSKYVDRMSFSAKDGKTELLMHFEH